VKTHVLMDNDQSLVCSVKINNQLIVKFWKVN